MRLAGPNRNRFGDRRRGRGGGDWVRWCIGAGLVGCVLAARAGGVGVGLSLAQAADQSWLRLEQDQREARREAGRMTPAESRALTSREQQEAMQLRQTLDAQRTAADALAGGRRAVPAAPAAPPLPDTRSFGLRMEQARELETLRLRQDLQRRTEGTPPGRSRWP